MTFDFGRVSILPSRRQQPPREVARQGFEGPSTALPYRGEMERRFGRDFSSVRAFTGPRATAASTVLGATAYTVGQDIAFARTHPDRGTVAHELTHVIQQQGGTARGIAMKSGRAPGPSSAEAEAEAVERAFRGGGPLPAISAQPAGTIARQLDKTNDQDFATSFWMDQLSAVGSFLDAAHAINGLFAILAPRAGMGAMAKLEFKYRRPIIVWGIPLPLQVGFNLELDTGRTTDSLEVKGNAALSAGLGGAIDFSAFAFLGEIGKKLGKREAHLLVRLAAKVKAKGNDGYECMRLIGLIIDSKLRDLSPMDIFPPSTWDVLRFMPLFPLPPLVLLQMFLLKVSGADIADAVFGRDYSHSVIGQMRLKTGRDGETSDTVEYAYELGFDVGAALTESVKGKFGVGGRWKGELYRPSEAIALGKNQEKSGLYFTGEVQLANKLKGKFDGFKAENDWEMEMKLEGSIPEILNKHTEGWLSGVPGGFNVLHALLSTVGLSALELLRSSEISLPEKRKQALLDGISALPHTLFLGLEEKYAEAFPSKIRDPNKKNLFNHLIEFELKLKKGSQARLRISSLVKRGARLLGTPKPGQATDTSYEFITRVQTPEILIPW